MKPNDTAVWPHAPAKGSRAPSTNAEMFALLDADLFLANQLFRHGLSCGVLDGVTVPAQRRERIRREIVAAELDEKPVIGRHGLEPETLAQAFERLYREPLIG
jgi:glyoxylase-like metal-dependent hydrolase (beta-lactamase superfamily II)